MSKKEIIWQEILNQFLEKKTSRFTQKELAKKFQISTSTVFNALKIPRASGAIEVKGRGFQITDTQKFLSIWATFRNLSKDIIYKTHISSSVNEIEGILPPDAIFAAYSAYRKKFHDVPADYDKVYVYSDDLAEIKKRFPFKKGYENLIVLRSDSSLKKYGLITPLARLYVDLWNLPEWYAKDFLNSLVKKLF